MSTALKPVRRIVTIDDAEGRSVAVADGPSPDVRGDPARPGFSSARIWVAVRRRQDRRIPTPCCGRSRSSRHRADRCVES
jgi:hypothetical protein